MFALRWSDENELERKFLPARFASRVQHRLPSRFIERPLACRAPKERQQSNENQWSLTSGK